MVDVDRIEAALPTRTRVTVIALAILAAAALAVGGGGNREEIVMIFGGCLLIYLILWMEFVKNG